MYYEQLGAISAVTCGCQPSGFWRLHEVLQVQPLRASRADGSVCPQCGRPQRSLQPRGAMCHVHLTQAAPHSLLHEQPMGLERGFNKHGKRGL